MPANTPLNPSSMMQTQTAGLQKRVGELEQEIKKLSGQQNLQQRIHHHAKIKVWPVPRAVTGLSCPADCFEAFYDLAASAWCSPVFGLFTGGEQLPEATG